MNINILIMISCTCMLFIIGKIFIIPIKKTLKLVVNSLIGGILIYGINVIGRIWGFHIGLNIYTSILVRSFRDTWRNFFNNSKIVSWKLEMGQLRTGPKCSVNKIEPVPNAQTEQKIPKILCLGERSI